MHAPLARHLARFSPVPPAGASTAPLAAAEVAPQEAEPTLTVTAFEARLEATRDALRATLEAGHAAERARAEAAHAETLAAAVNAAAAHRDAEAAAALAAQIAIAMQDLRDMLSGQLASALRPLLAEAVAARAASALVDTVERVLADPDHPVLTLRGPAPLLAAVEAALGAESVTFEATDGDEITVTANGIRIETRLDAALAAVAAMEGA